MPIGGKMLNWDDYHKEEITENKQEKAQEKAEPQVQLQQSEPVADTANQVTTPAATGQGATNGTVSWTPALPGRFYYQCSSHADMWGQIEVLPRVDWNNTDNIGDGPNRYLYSPLFSTGDNIQYKGPISRT